MIMPYFSIHQKKDLLAPVTTFLKKVVLGVGRMELGNWLEKWGLKQWEEGEGAL